MITSTNTSLNESSNGSTGQPIILGPFAGLPPNPNKTRGNHWSKLYKEGQTWKELVAYAGLAYRSKTGHRPLESAQVAVHVSVGDNRVHDGDNIVASLKAPLDGLKGIIIVDDSIDHIGIPTYSVDRLKPRQFTITVTPR